MNYRVAGSFSDRKQARENSKPAETNMVITVLEGVVGTIRTAMMVILILPKNILKVVVSVLNVRDKSIDYVERVY